MAFTCNKCTYETRQLTDLVRHHEDDHGVARMHERNCATCKGPIYGPGLLHDECRASKKAKVA